MSGSYAFLFSCLKGSVTDGTAVCTPVYSALVTLMHAMNVLATGNAVLSFIFDKEMEPEKDGLMLCVEEVAGAISLMKHLKTREGYVCRQREAKVLDMEDAVHEGMSVIFNREDQCVTSSEKQVWKLVHPQSKAVIEICSSKKEFYDNCGHFYVSKRRQTYSKISHLTYP